MTCFCEITIYLQSTSFKHVAIYASIICRDSDVNGIMVRPRPYSPAPIPNPAAHPRYTLQTYIRIQHISMGRIVVTGGSGKAGQFIIAELLSNGHTVLNLDLSPTDHPEVYTLKTGLADSGQPSTPYPVNGPCKSPFQKASPSVQTP